MHKFLVRHNLVADRFDLLGVDKSPDKTAAVVPVTYEVKDPGEAVSPFMSIEPEAAQSLVDQLWEAGVRPAGALQQIAAASQQAGGQVAPWLMKQLEKFINQSTKESANAQG